MPLGGVHQLRADAWSAVRFLHGEYLDPDRHQARFTRIMPGRIWLRPLDGRTDEADNLPVFFSYQNEIVFSADV